MHFGSSEDNFSCFTRLNPCVAHCSTVSILWVHHSREEGSLDYNGGFVRSQIHMKFDTNIQRQHPPVAPRLRLPPLDLPPIAWGHGWPNYMKLGRVTLLWLCHGKKALEARFTVLRIRSRAGLRSEPLVKTPHGAGAWARTLALTQGVFTFSFCLEDFFFLSSLQRTKRGITRWTQKIYQALRKHYGNAADRCFRSEHKFKLRSGSGDSCVCLKAGLIRQRVTTHLSSSCHFEAWHCLRGPWSPQFSRRPPPTPFIPKYSHPLAST
jgi:hypothetical protein